MCIGEARPKGETQNCVFSGIRFIVFLFNLWVAFSFILSVDDVTLHQLSDLWRISTRLYRGLMVATTVATAGLDVFEWICIVLLYYNFCSTFRWCNVYCGLSHLLLLSSITLIYILHVPRMIVIAVLFVCHKEIKYTKTHQTTLVVAIVVIIALTVFDIATQPPTIFFVGVYVMDAHCAVRTHLIA